MVLIEKDKEYLLNLTSLQNDEFTLQISYNFIKIRNILQNIEPNTKIIDALISIVDGNVNEGKIFFKNICHGMTIKKAIKILLKQHFKEYITDILLLICVLLCKAIFIYYFILLNTVLNLVFITLGIVLINLFKDKLTNNISRFYTGIILIVLLILIDILYDLHYPVEIIQPSLPVPVDTELYMF